MLRGRYPVGNAVRCIGCGCSNMRACPAGCSWYRINPPICSACIDSGRLCADSPDGEHTLVWLNRRSGFCDTCHLPFVAREAA